MSEIKFSSTYTIDFEDQRLIVATNDDGEIVVTEVDLDNGHRCRSEITMDTMTARHLVIALQKHLGDI